MPWRRSDLQFVVIALATSIGPVSAQVVNTTAMDTIETTIIGHVGLGGYVDGYYTYNFNQPPSGVTPYFVSSARHNEFTVNLAYVDVRYRSHYMRARFVPGFGTYMDATYANEPGSLQNMVEATVGVLVSDKRKIWVDVGVLSSPYSSESPISKDQLMYLRSFAPETTPYYVTGVKLSVPVSQKVNGYLYVINGWQVIQDNNSGKSVGTQIEYRPDKNMLFNWNTYVGDERSSAAPDYRTRYFTDAYWIYNSGGRWTATSCAFVGLQEREGFSDATWWGANLIGKYAFSEVFTLSGRIEYFNDPFAIIIKPSTGPVSFEAFSYGICANFQLHNLAMFRIEARQFSSKDNSFTDKDGFPSNSSTIVAGSLTAWF